MNRHRWFAWHPVRVSGKGWVWLRWTMRELDIYSPIPFDLRWRWLYSIPFEKKQ